jgi:phosphoglycolate phosphatase-like HAD superfamily hydrolase
MLPRKIDTLILDLDNTIFDRFAMWYASFKPIYDEILAASGRPQGEVEADIRRVHQTRRTSEYTFLIEELDVLREIRAREDIRTRFHNALETSRHGRDQSLQLYPTVFSSLWRIKNAGSQIIGYTESMRFYSSYRLKRFGLDGVIEILFSPKDHDMPAGVPLDQLRRFPDDFYELQVTKVMHTPPHELKPNPKVLREIIEMVGSSPDRCAYVGDSIFKDVAMAREAGIFDVHAQYGESQKYPEYEILQRVSHWTEDDVQREAAIMALGHDFVPSAVLKDSFAEIFIHCDFEAFSRAKTDDDQTKNAMETWKKCVDVQQHFNDLCLRIRNLAITVVGALLAGVGFTYQYGLEAEFVGYKFAAGIGFVVAAIFAWAAFFFMDRLWYHMLLRGAVSHASSLENQFNGLIPGIGLTNKISDASRRVRVFGIKLDSKRRLEAFYAIGFLMLVVVFTSLLFAKPSRPTTNPTPSSQSKLIEPNPSSPEKPAEPTIQSLQADRYR